MYSRYLSAARRTKLLVGRNIGGMRHDPEVLICQWLFIFSRLGAGYSSGNLGTTLKVNDQES